MKTSKTLSFCAAAGCYAAAGAAAILLGPLYPASALLTAVAADFAATLVVFAASAAFNNSSLYDPYWSVAPLGIAAFWTLRGAGFGQGGLRAAVVLLLLAVWAVRLTFNWARRWRGLSDEDWRYSDFRRLGKAGYWTVSFLGFHVFPTVLVFLGCLALYPVLSLPSGRAGLLDVAGVGICLAAIWIEARADSQLRTFLIRRAPGEVLHTGLWAFSRHPNYFGEVLFWWGVYAFCLGANPAFWWTLIGPVSISLLFVFVSVPMMERHMETRHPGYREAQRRRSPLVPWFQTRRTDK